MLCSRFAALLGEAVVAGVGRPAKHTRPNGFLVRVFDTTQVIRARNVSGRFLSSCQQTAREQWTMISCCKSLALHRRKIMIYG